MDCIDGMKQIEDNSIDLVITSPPYNVGVKYDSWDDLKQSSDYFDFAKNWLTEVYRILKPTGRIALNIPYEVNFLNRGGRIFFASEYWRIMQQIGYKWAGLVDLHEAQPQRVKRTVWGSYLSASAPYIYNPKECVIIAYKETWKRKIKKSYFEDKTDSKKKEFIELVFGIWKYKAETKGLTEANFSEDLPLKALKILSDEGDIVLDPFMGSGTTAVACIKLKRNFIGFEISKEYCDIANKRIADAQAQKLGD